MEQKLLQSRHGEGVGALLFGPDRSGEKLERTLLALELPALLFEGLVESLEPLLPPVAE